MGAESCVESMMKTSVALAIALFAIVGAVSADFSDENEFVQSETESVDSPMAMMQALKDMRKSAPMHLKFHVSRINKHAMLLQRAKAYGHDFSASSRAIKAALTSLLTQLNAGHKHDKAALAAAHKNSKAAISTTESNGKTKCVEYKNKACPTKRIEGEAKAKMDAAHTKMRNIGKGKACDSFKHGTWGGMDVDKSHPKFGTVVRTAWDTKRGQYVAAHAKWTAEKKVFETAQKAHTEAMAAFTTAVKIEASNANTACKNAHKQYNDLKNEVASNVKSRKHVYIASLIITCYVDNLKSNSGAKACADKKRKSDTSQWNISATPLDACTSTAVLQTRFGPLDWKPSSKSCELKHWNERAHKEMQTKEKNTKEANAKEMAAKAKLERDTKAAKEKKEKEDERKLKERNTKEAQMKENNSKEKSLKKEKSDKEKATKESQAKEKVKKEKDAKEKAAKEKAAKKKEASNKESSKKEKDAKERATKKERSDKEKVSKEKLEKEKAREEKKNKAIEKDKKEKTSKEKAEKEKAAKAAAIAKEKDDKARERKSKDDERNAKKKEQQSKEATAKSNERNDKAAAAERKKKADEKEQKRRAAGTCTVTAYEHNSYRGRVEQRHSICHRGRYDIRYGTYGRRRGFQASSFKLSSGCQQVQLWDEDACRYGYGDNVNIHHSVSSVKYDLNDDICAISIWSKC